MICESVRQSANALHIQVIVETFEHYKSIKVGQLKYINSMQFMNTSLANLMKNLDGNHPIISKHFKELGYSLEQLDLVYHKKIYPYDYINSQNRFLKTKLPPIYEFTTNLYGKII